LNQAVTAARIAEFGNPGGFFSREPAFRTIRPGRTVLNGTALIGGSRGRVGVVEFATKLQARSATVPDLNVLRQELRDIDDQGDDTSWPEKMISVMRDAGCFGNVIARAYGGNETDPHRMIETYQSVGAGSITAALILTQHDSACDLIGNCDNESLAADLLPDCATGQKLATVGISQLTTSKRHHGVAMRAERDGDEYVLNGVMPWVTSVQKADIIVTGAELDDGQQILGCVPMNAPGVSPGAPMELMSLRTSWTGEVRCKDVRLTPDLLMRGPADKVLALRAPVKPLKVSSVGLGLATALLDELWVFAENLDGAPELIADKVAPDYEAVKRRLYAAADKLHDPEAELPSGEIRADVNALVIRLAATLMTLAKGSGYLSSHPAQRLAREAMFFLVWSAPDAVRIGSLERIWR